ncbi:subtilisin-like protease 4 isoform X2 [Salvia hispanica]|uniref:subtilisin-like protease 4 isoform X2 n=1 Tax=Salvia hispanica TaxID=49212 RepID=UPI00200956C9|nr:subtilisin-like protease 4 isoform X2 [Salvia hispanica]
MALLSSTIIIVCLFCITSLPLFASQIPNKNSLQIYIVHVEAPNAHVASESEDLESWYRSFLPATTASSSEDEAHLVYSYRHVFKGFAARLSPEHVKEMEKKKGFISARPQMSVSLHTTHSPNFLGLHQNMGLWEDSNYGKGVIIGVLDTGLMPEHPSFSDEGMPPPPAKWKGECEFSHTTCNNKIIGARYFNDGDQSPLDDNGHGTHTAGTAAGVAPLAHLAIYKVLKDNSEGDAAFLAGMDAAIEDGVDVLSISIGYKDATQIKTLYDDDFSISAFSAMEKGIFVSYAAGNSGPHPSSVGHWAPWVLTVGASTLDRKLSAKAVLGNNQEVDGESVYDFPRKLFPLVYAPNCRASDIRGKIVVCEKDRTKEIPSGAVGVILINSETHGNTIQVAAIGVPTTHFSYVAGLKIKAYINSTATPTATISSKGTVIGDERAPVVASFSSRGPSIPTPGILKPDILGPGVNILAASHDTSIEWKIDSGTSMACPHLSGVAALLKSVHPDWSPAAIKSAIMTTADDVNLAGNPIEDERFVPADIFATGSGHVNPSRAKDPGLVYDIHPQDYLSYLCGLGYTDRQVELFLHRRVNCAVESRIAEAELNYPSFSIIFSGKSTNSQVYTRTVTNVGDPDSSYEVEISPPSGVDVRVEPTTLNFSETKQKLQYKVTFSRLTPNTNFVQGFLKWTSPSHSVRSPIVVRLS